jgi:DNA-binding transcriptional LysR family regulator
MELRHLRYFQAVAEELSFLWPILRYVEAGAGVGIVPESAGAEAADVVLVPLLPKSTVPMVVVWGQRGGDPAVSAFRDLVLQWRADGRIR